MPNENTSVPHRRWADPSKTADYIDKSESRLAKLRHFGGGPPFVKIGRSVLYDLDDVDRWLEGRKRRSTSDAGGSAS